MKCTEFSPSTTAQRSSCKWPHWGCKARNQPKETQMGLIPKFTVLLPGHPITVSQSCREGWSAYFSSKSRPLSYQLAVGLRASQVALVVKNLPANAGDIRDVVWLSRSGRSPGGGNGNTLQYSCLENPMDRGSWWATVHRVPALDTTQVT